MGDVLLRGCQPEPLQSYLKAMGVFRLVGEQLDPSVRGAWTPAGFRLAGAFDENALVAFFCNAWCPTPIVTPWNGGSGFYDGDNTEGIDRISASDTPRLASYRQVIEMVRTFPELAVVPPTAAEVISIMEAYRDSLRSGSKERDKADDLLRAVDRALVAVLAAGRADPRPRRRAEVDAEAEEKAAPKELTSWKKEFGKLVTFYKQIRRGGGKVDLMAACRDRLPDVALPWLDAAYQLTTGEKGQVEPDYAAVLGSGGNEGRLDYSNNHMTHIAALLCSGPPAEAALRASLLGTLTKDLAGGAAGQFEPGRAGGVNQGVGFEAQTAPLNRWDYVLGLEGTLLLASAVSRRYGASVGARSSPFSVHISTAGFSSASDEDRSGRAETWLPLWSRPATLAEVQHLFSEGRSTVGGQATRTGYDFARAVASLGVDRGVTGFIRYGFLKRRGDSFVAHPLARIPVRWNPRVLLLNDLDPLRQELDALRKGFQTVPATLAAARNRLDEALFRVATRGDTADCQDVVKALGRFQRYLSTSPRSAKPLGAHLQPAWLDALDDGSPAFRIGSALASIGPEGSVGPWVANLLPVDPKQPWTWAKGKGRGQRAWEGSSLASCLASVLERRLLDAADHAGGRVPCASRLGVSLEDLGTFLYGATDDACIEDLAWGLTLLDWKGMATRTIRGPTPGASFPIPRAFAAMKLLFVPLPVRGVTQDAEPRIVPLLRAGHVAEAIRLASRRLTTSGLVPHAFDPTLPGMDPLRLSAALLLPTRDVVGLAALALKKPSDPA